MTTTIEATWVFLIPGARAGCPARLAHTTGMRGSWTGSGRPVVLLHGQPGGAGDWQPVLPYLSGLRILAPDRPGYDGTPAGGFSHNAQELAAALSRAGVDRAVLVGHSWGGGVALQLAVEQPHRVAGICLIGSVGSPLAVNRVDRALALPVMRRFASAVVCCAAALAPATAGRMSGSNLTPAMSTQLREVSRRRLKPATWRSFAVEQKALIADTAALSESLTQVIAPCLVLNGTRDRSVCPEAAAHLAHHLPNSSLSLIPGGHLLPWEAPAAVAGNIRDIVAIAAW